MENQVDNQPLSLDTADSYVQEVMAGSYNSIEPQSSQIVKLDVQTGEVKVKEIENTHMTCEPIFLSKPDAVKEDEGVVLVPILACKKGSATYLLILDAESMIELARAEVPVEHIVSFNFHGCFSKHKQTGDGS